MLRFKTNVFQPLVVYNGHGIENIGLRKIHSKTFSNASGVEDGRYNKGLIFNGNILEI